MGKRRKKRKSTEEEIAPELLNRPKLTDPVDEEGNPLDYKKAFLEYIDEKYGHLEFSPGAEKAFLSPKVPAKSEDGIEYIVLNELPEEQKKAFSHWLTGLANTAPIIEKEGGDTYCFYYHEYEAFYEAWIHDGSSQVWV